MTVSEDEWVHSDPRGAQGRQRAGGRRGSTTRTVGSGRPRSSAGSPTTARSRSGSGSRCPPSTRWTACGTRPPFTTRRRPSSAGTPRKGVHGRDARVTRPPGCSTVRGSASRRGDQLAELIRAGAEAGWPIAVHAIGDRANREALDAFAATRDAWQPRGLRQRIEHAQCLDPCRRPALRRARRRLLRAAQPRPGRTAIWRSASGATASRARTPSARWSTRAPSSRTARTRRSRSSTRSRGSARACSARSTTARRGGPRRPSRSIRRSMPRRSLRPG